MSLISEHRKTRENKSRIALHEFKIRFKKDSNIIYGFVEGKDDPCFYRGFIENAIPHDWDIELWNVGGKEGVIDVYSKIDWRSFRKSQILFFVDKDLSEFTKEVIRDEINIYVTNNYSIENDIVNSVTCNRVLREVCGFSELEYQISDQIKIHFDEQLECFQKALIPAMSNIIIWRKNNNKANLNDICMKHVFQIRNGYLKEISRPKKKENLIVYIHDQCNLRMTDGNSIAEITEIFEEKKYYEKYIRGKYLLWFLVEFCLSIYRDYNTLSFIEINKKPKMVTTLSQSNAIVLIATRCKIPLSLKSFFKNTIEKYIALKKAA